MRPSTSSYLGLNPFFVSSRRASSHCSCLCRGLFFCELVTTRLGSWFSEVIPLEEEGLGGSFCIAQRLLDGITYDMWLFFGFF